jgi:predicted metal-dependent hydrolase
MNKPNNNTIAEGKVMQITINVPDNLPLATVEKFVQRIERRLIKKAAIVEFKKSRPIGLAKGEFKVPVNFFEPLPDYLIQAFEGFES